MGAGVKINRDDDYFSCITRAFETLGTQAKRIAYDSVDPEFNDDIPSSKESKKANFFEVRHDGCTPHNLITVSLALDCRYKLKNE